jgi:hypothetical protein
MATELQTTNRKSQSVATDQHMREQLLTLLQLSLCTLEHDQQSKLINDVRRLLVKAKLDTLLADPIHLLLCCLESDYLPLSRLLCTTNMHQIVAAAASINQDTIRTESLISAIDLCYRALNIECARQGIFVRDYGQYKNNAISNLGDGRKKGTDAIRKKAEERRNTLKSEALDHFYHHPTDQYKSVWVLLAQKHGLGISTVAKLIRGTKEEALAKLEKEKSPLA